MVRGGGPGPYIKVLYDEKGEQTPLLAAAWKAYREGAVLGGSSAGAAIMSDPMIGGGTSLDALLRGVREGLSEDGDRENMLVISKGLGFFSRGTVDQHFSQRGRLGRLIVAALFAKKELAFGIDEDTAMVVDNRSRLISVVGAHGLTIVDLSKVRHEGTPSRIAVRDILVTYLKLVSKDDLLDSSTGSMAAAGEAPV